MGIGRGGVLIRPGKQGKKAKAKNRSRSHWLIKETKKIIIIKKKGKEKKRKTKNCNLKINIKNLGHSRQFPLSSLLCLFPPMISASNSRWMFVLTAWPFAAQISSKISQKQSHHDPFLYATGPLKSITVTSSVPPEASGSCQFLMFASQSSKISNSRG